MTDQEIEKLREKLGSDYSVKRQNGAITVELVDIWKGVEFAEFKGSVFKIDKFDGLTFYENGWSISKYDCKPSTESAYVEQLKAKAKELYGEIKDEDRFWIDENLGEVSMYDCEDGFSYWKEEDLLYFGNYAIYSKGKWAKKIEEPIRVTVYADQSVDGKTQVGMTIKSEFPLNINSRKEFLNHIQEAIESYLNKNP